MATQNIKLSKKENLMKRPLSFIMMVILLAGLALGLYLIIGPAAENESAVAHRNVQRAFEADAARYSAIVDFYEAKAAAERAARAETTRYEALADLYTKSERGLEADAARYTGLATFFGAEPRGITERALEAQGARHQGLAEFYTAEAKISPRTLRMIWDQPQPSSLMVEKDTLDLAANPELAIAQRYTTALETEAAGSIFVATHSELSAKSRQLMLAMKNELPNSSFVASNPELSAARRHSTLQ
jgi:hypothetical protein